MIRIPAAREMATRIELRCPDPACNPYLELSVILAAGLDGIANKIEAPKTELNIDESIKETCQNAGHLKIVWDRPRKNTVKLLLLIDSDGSMRMHMDLCNRLFKAVNKSNHFHDLKIYYFHNCIYDYLYTDPLCLKGHWIETDWVFNNSEIRTLRGKTII